MTPEEISDWYNRNGVKQVREDWGERDPETGEGLENVGHSYWGEGQSFGPERLANLPLTPGVINHLDEQNRLGALWQPRSEMEREEVEAREEFFEPYLSMLTTAKGNLIREYLGMRRPQSEIAEEMGVSQQAVSKQLATAMRQLIRMVARDDVQGAGTHGNPADAALCVYTKYWRKKFGHDPF